MRYLNIISFLYPNVILKGVKVSNDKTQNSFSTCLVIIMVGNLKI